MKWYPCSLAVLLAFAIGCQSSGGPEPPDEEPGQAPAARYVTDLIPLQRQQIKTEPVLTHRQKLPDDLNTWFFDVRLYETEATFTYRLVMQYEEVRGEQDISFPNLGVMPQPYFEPVSGKLAVVVGFLDKQGNRRPYKQVSAENGQLKVTTLQRYAVVEKPGDP